MNTSSNHNIEAIGRHLGVTTDTLDFLLSQAPPSIDVLNQLDDIRKQAAHIGSLATRLMQQTWQAHGDAPESFLDIDTTMLGGAILPARMHRPNPHTAQPVKLQIVGDRTIAGDNGTHTFTEHDETELMLFNSCLAYRYSLPNARTIEARTGWSPIYPLRQLQSHCQTITGAEIYRLRNQGSDGTQLWISPHLQITDARVSLPLE